MRWQPSLANKTLNIGSSQGTKKEGKMLLLSVFFFGTWNIKDCKKALEEAELLGLEKKIWGLGGDGRVTNCIAIEMRTENERLVQT